MLWNSRTCRSLTIWWINRLLTSLPKRTIVQELLFMIIDNQTPHLLKSLSVQSTMWRYIAGIKRPLPSTTTSKRMRAVPQETTSSDEESEEGTEATERHFVSSWKTRYLWLEHDRGKMYCTLCKTCKKKKILEHQDPPISEGRCWAIIAKPLNTLTLFELH